MAIYDNTGSTHQGVIDVSDFSFDEFCARLGHWKVWMDDTHAAYALYCSVGYKHLVPYLSFLRLARLRCGRTVGMLSQLVTLDRDLCSLMLDSIGAIELQTRSLFGEAFMRTYGPEGFFDGTNFRFKKVHAAAVRSLTLEFLRQQKRSSSGHGRSANLGLSAGPRCSSSCRSSADSEVPAGQGRTSRPGSPATTGASANPSPPASPGSSTEPGAHPDPGSLIECSTATVLWELLSLTRSPLVANAVARSFSTNSRCFKSWFRTLVHVRNACAHHNPYVVRPQIPAVLKAVHEYDGNSEAPLYALVLIERLLAGRAEAGLDGAKDDLHSFVFSATELLSDFAIANPDLAKALRIPTRYLGLAKRGRGRRVSLGEGRGSVEYWCA